MIQKNEQITAPEMPHTLKLGERVSLSIGGVLDVDSFDEQTVKLLTTCGALTVCGAGLHITALHLESGDMHIDGRISSLIYTEHEPRRSLLARIFR